MLSIIPTVRLVRLEETYDDGTFGALIICSQLFCFTLEPTDKNNAPNVSSIPAQQYICKRYSSNKYPNTFEVTNVPGRSYILFHPGNTDDDTAGCILLGSSIGKLRKAHGVDVRGILNSGKTFEKFMGIMQHHNKFNLTIKEFY